MRVLVTGGAGRIGSALIGSAPGGVDLHATRLHRSPPAAARVHTVQLRDPAAVRAVIDEVAPDVVVHTAYRIDAEADIVAATRNVAAAAARRGAALVHLSTDTVFDGEHAPYRESDVTGPINDYGRWKLLAEDAVPEEVADACVTRSSIVVSLDPADRGCATALAAARGDSRTGFFHDEIRTPILVEDLCARLWALVALPRDARAGVWHLPGPEALSRLELARRLCAAHGVDPSPLQGRSSAGVEPPRPRDLTLVADRLVPGAPALRRIGAHAGGAPGTRMHGPEDGVGTVSPDGQEA